VDLPFRVRHAHAWISRRWPVNSLRLTDFISVQPHIAMSYANHHNIIVLHGITARWADCGHQLFRKQFPVAFRSAQHRRESAARGRGLQTKTPDPFSPRTTPFLRVNLLSPRTQNFFSEFISAAHSFINCEFQRKKNVRLARECVKALPRKSRS
jgi:hypothetical protein